MPNRQDHDKIAFALGAAIANKHFRQRLNDLGHAEGVPLVPTTGNESLAQLISRAGANRFIAGMRADDGSLALVLIQTSKGNPRL